MFYGEISLLLSCQVKVFFMGSCTFSGRNSIFLLLEGTKIISNGKWISTKRVKKRFIIGNRLICDDRLKIVTPTVTYTSWSLGV